MDQSSEGTQKDAPEPPAAEATPPSEDGMPLLSPDDVDFATPEAVKAAPNPVSVPDTPHFELPQSQEGAGEDRSLDDVTSQEGAFEDATEDGMRLNDYDPPSIPGIRHEITRPRKLQHILPHVVAEPESGRQTPPARLDAILSEETVDISLPPMTADMGSSDQSGSDEYRTVEGAPFDEGTEVSALPPIPGAQLVSKSGEAVILEQSLGDQRGSVFYRARIEGVTQPFTAVWVNNPRPSPPWHRIPDSRLVRPRAHVTLEGANVRVFERPKGNTVVDYLTSPERSLPAMATIELGIELAEILESLHGAGCYVYDLEPSQIVIERGGKVRLYSIGGFYQQNEMPSGLLGVFSAPEIRHGLRYLTGAHSDVYAVALLLYALLARRAPIEPGLDPNLLVNPRVFRPECPLGIWPYLREALVAQPRRRTSHARGLWLALCRARDRLRVEVQNAERPARVVLEAWAEVHTGLGKARRGADQQDRAIGMTANSGRSGLYVVADGVSRSKYGDGAYASEQVYQSAIKSWSALEKAGPAAMSLTHAQRTDVLRQITRSAGKRISAEVNKKCAPMPNEPNQVMSTTVSAAFIHDGEATIANLGDSRSYLIRDHTIERIAIDHDRTTDALRMGLGFVDAAEVKMGSALTRVVGRVVIGADGVTKPDPFEPEIFRVQLMPGDKLLLCSDGVPDFAAGAGAKQYVAEKKMMDVIEEFDDPARAAFELVVLANRGGGYDNIGCIVIAAHADDG